MGRQTLGPIISSTLTPSPYEWNKETPSGQNSEISYACLNADGDYTTLNLINVTTVPVDEAPVLSSEENPALHTEFLSDKYIGAVNQYSIADVLFSIFMESTDPEKDEPTYIVTELPVSGLSTDTGVRIDRVGQKSLTPQDCSQPFQPQAWLKIAFLTLQKMHRQRL